MKDKLYKMMNWPAIEAIVYGDESQPQKILGRHNVAKHTLFQAFFPNAKAVVLKLPLDNHQEAEEHIMECADEDGFYAVAVLGKVTCDYQYIVTDINGNKNIFFDSYDNLINLSKSDINNFKTGKTRDAYRYMGAHFQEVNKKSGIAFHVWAPNAVRVSVVGEFNKWNGKAHPMVKDEESGIFSLFIPGISKDIEYRYEINAKGNNVYTKLDPYGAVSASGNSILMPIDNFKWEDEVYFESKKRFDRFKAPLSICRMELTEFLDEKGNINYKKIKDNINHLKAYCYDYLHLYLTDNEFMGFCLSVYNDRFKELVNALHIEKIGIILDCNFSYFKDGDRGLSCFDGTYLYGHMDEHKRYNSAYGELCLNYGRQEVASLLKSKAFYYMEELHVDGFYMDGLSSMLYLDYGKHDGEWSANIYGGNENLEAIEFIKNMNYEIHNHFPHAITIAKAEGVFLKVTEALSKGGLGFDYIINNGFEHDLSDYINNCKNISKLTDNMAYAHNENYIIPLSNSIKKELLAYFMARPGKKLVCKGMEDEKSFCLLEKAYHELPALHSLDRNPYGFEWIKAINTGDGVLAFIRKDEYLNHSILVVCNFSDLEYPNYKLGISYEGKYKMLFSSDDKKLGGNTVMETRYKNTDEEIYDGCQNSLTLKIAPNSTTYYSYTPYNEAELLKIAEKKVAKYKAKVEKEAREKAKALKTAESAIKIDV